MTKQLWFALVSGLIVSIALAGLEALHHATLWMIPQIPGFLLGASIWGVHSGGYSFETVMIAFNAFTYAVVVLIIWTLFRSISKLASRTSELKSR